MAKSGLKKWFAQKWVDIGSKDKQGNFKPCGRSKQKADAKRKYPKCVPLAKANRMTKGERQSAVKRKRAKAQGVGGKPTNVKTFAVQGGILLDEAMMPAVKDIGDETKFVSHYMDVLVDSEIDETIVCSAIADLKSRDIYVDLDIECPDISTIYNPALYDPTTEVCPTDVDTGGSCEV